MIEGHPLTRSWLRNCLAGHAEIVGECASGGNGIEAVIAAAPDVAIVDLNLPDISGIEVIQNIAALQPATKVLVLTESEDRNDVAESFKAGAIGYLIKDGVEEHVRDAVRAAAADRAVISSSIAGVLMEYIRSLPSSNLEDGAVRVGMLSVLTARELDVLRLVARGWGNRRIADKLHISDSTVKNHVASILKKLHLVNRVQAAVAATQGGLLH